MRILMIAACPLPWSRGTPIRIHRMAEALVARGHDVHVVTYPLGDETRSVSYKIHRVGRRSIRVDPRPGPSLMKLIYLDPLVCLRIRRMLGSGEFDLIHAHHYEGLLASLLARRSSHKIPIVYDAHTLLESELPFYTRWIPRAVLSRFGRMLDLRVPRHADHIIGVTDSMQHWFVTMAGITPDCISVIPNGVEYEHFDSENSDVVRTTRAPRIVFAGNLAAYQGVHLLLAAFAHVRAELPDAELFLMGGTATASLLAQLDELGITSSVHFEDPDYTSLPARLATADVLVNPRIVCHGIPQKLLNYMATGRPIVSFASSAAVLEHERDGLIVADGDIRGFADAILRLICDPALAHSLGLAATVKVIADHSWSAVADQVAAVYTRVIESN